MSDLVAHEAVSRSEAFARCERFLRARSRAWRLVRLGVGAERRGELAAHLAWYRSLRAAEGPGLEALAGELERVLDGRPRTPLGVALLGCVQRFALDPALLQGGVLAQRADRHTGALASWEELLAHARELSRPEARGLLCVLEERGERARALADALGAGLQLARWSAGLQDELARGRLRVAADELFRFGTSAQRLRDAPADEGVRRLVAAQVARARELLARGWPLCRELGPRRGRALAFVLRWHAAELSALEVRGFAPRPAGRAAGGWLRGLACAAAALGGRPPRLDA